ncbi:MAG: hypothetical protein ACTSYD_07740 [Candidatus Heimdallarchaeaceae archaeon]
MEKEAFIMQMRQIIEIKEKISEMLLKFDISPGNTLYEAIIHGIGYNAKKHIEIFQGLLDRAQGITEPLSAEGKDKIKELLDTIIELEWNVEVQLKTITDKITDDKTRKILLQTLGDVQRDKAILADIKELADSMTEEEENVMDKIWKYSVTFDD